MRILLSLAMALLTTISFGQGLEEQFDSSCNCWKMTNHYDNGQVSEEFVENEARKRHGESRHYSYEGQLLRQEYWQNGKLHGDCKAFHRDGSLYYTSHFDQGKKIGKWVFQEPDGTIYQEIEYNGNGADGVYTYYHAGVKYLVQHIEKGKLASETVINEEILQVVKEESAAAASKK